MKKYWGTAVCLFVFGACASSAVSDLEKARFALDDSNYDKAVTEGSSALTEDPSSVEAALVLSSAYAGRGGIDLLALISDLQDTANDNAEFSAIHTSLVSNIESLGDMRSSIATLFTTLTPQPAATHDFFADQQFQMGALESVEGFGLSTLTAQPTADAAIDVSLITDAIADTAETDFINADNHLINAGFAEDNELVVNVRKNFCVLNNASGGGSGFSTAALRDLTLCQLHDSPDSLGDADLDTVATCNLLNFGACDGTVDTE